MNFKNAIVRVPSPEFCNGVTTADLGLPEYQATLVQHKAYCDALQSCGLTVTELPPLAGFPDAPFVEDTAVVVPELAVITRPGHPARIGEEESMEPALAEHKPVGRITAPGTLDGGDVLLVDRSFFVGISDRTNDEGARQLGELVAPHGYTVTPVPVAAGLHLKSSINIVAPDTLLATPDFAGRPEFAAYNILTVAPAEAYAGNTLHINGTLITPTGYPETLTLLKALELPVIELDTSEFRKLDGGLTCLSLRF